LNDCDGNPCLYISYGDPHDSIHHERVDRLPNPISFERWEAWQEQKTPPEETRASMLESLSDHLIYEYLLTANY